MTTTTPRAPALPPSTRTLLALAAGVVVLAGVHTAREVLAPILLAAVIVIICHPVRFPLERRGWPRWAATTAVVVVAYLILAVLVAMLVFAGFRFADLVREYLPALVRSVEDVVDQLSAERTSAGRYSRTRSANRKPAKTSIATRAARMR